MRQLISAQMDDVYFPITIKEFGSRIYFRDPREQTVFIIAPWYKTMLLSHPGYCLGYRIEYKGRSICYIIDTTYTDEKYQRKVGWGHSSVGQVVELAHDAKVDTLYLFHHDPDQSDDDIDAKLKTAVGLLGEKNSSTRRLGGRQGEGQSPDYRRARAKASGMDGYGTKPLNAQTFVEQAQNIVAAASGR